MIVIPVTIMRMIMIVMMMLVPVALVMAAVMRIIRVQSRHGDIGRGHHDGRGCDIDRGGLSQAYPDVEFIGRGGGAGEKVYRRSACKQFF